MAAHGTTHTGNDVHLVHINNKTGLVTTLDAFIWEATHSWRRTQTIESPVLCMSGSTNHSRPLMTLSISSRSLWLLGFWLGEHSTLVNNLPHQMATGETLDPPPLSGGFILSEADWRSWRKAISAFISWKPVSNTGVQVDESVESCSSPSNSKPATHYHPNTLPAPE